MNTNPKAADALIKIVGAIFSLVGLILGWIFHGIKYTRDKRLEARNTVYPAIYTASVELKNALDEHKRLFISKPYDCISDKGNIYTLCYLQSKRQEYCSSYHNISPAELDTYKSLAHNLSDILKSHQNCIHPKVFEKGKWIACKQTLIEFCDYLQRIDGRYVGEYDYLTSPNHKEPIHIENCEALNNAFKYIINSTKK